MDEGSPRLAPSRGSSQLLPIKSRGTQALRPRASDVKARGGDANLQAAEDERSNSSDIRRQRSSAPTGGGAHDGLHARASMVPSEADATDAGSPKKHVIRLTLTEAADEIKRLRRAERQHAAETKLRDEEKKILTEEASKLRQQLANSERARKEEQAALQIRYDRDTKKLNDQLTETRDELQVLQETSLPLIEARKLTFKALRKGRALQYMAQLYTNNTLVMSVKREALHKLLENAVGTDHAVFRATHGFACGVQSYTDSHLRLLRQEQLILLAENERLQAQIQDMQQRAENSKRDRLQQHESSLAGRSDANWLQSQSREASMTIAGSPSRSGVQAWERERSELEGVPSSLPVHGMGLKVKDAEINLVDAKLRSIQAVLSMGRARLLSYALRRYDAARRMALNEQLKQAQQKATAAENHAYPESTCRACHAWSILSSDLNQRNATGGLSPALQGSGAGGGFGLAPSQGGGIPLPVAYAPHYFRDLPSTQKRRNLYFTAAPPRAPQQSFPTAAQRARDMARTQETFYRPITAVEGWQRTGGNGLGIGMEPVGTVVGSHAASQETKLGSAKDTLKGTLLLPS
ncbi:hypothetical protein ACSSS7_002194 [Eimeria intestinalis]